MIHCFLDSSSDGESDSDSNVSDKEMDSDKENDSTPQDSPDMTAVMQNLIQKGEILKKKIIIEGKMLKPLLWLRFNFIMTR